MKPEIDMGATQIVGSDRYACTIIDITPSGKTITVQNDTAIRTDNNGRSSYQEYRYEPNPNGDMRRFRFVRGAWRNGTVRLVLGERDHYYDFDF